MKKLLLLAVVLAVTGCAYAPTDVECYINDTPTAYIDKVVNFRHVGGGVLEIENQQGRWYYKLDNGEFCRRN
jgi:hypothetical protein